MFWPHLDIMRWTAFGLFTAAAITDFFDGYLARAWSQQSALGQMLDPIADKLLVAAMLFMLVSDRTIVGISVVAAIVILCREVLVSGLREFLADLKVSIPVSKVAKWKTTAQLLALGFLIVGPAGDKVLPPQHPDRSDPPLGRGDPDPLHRVGLPALRGSPYHRARGLIA